jgi:hypothetical protein
MVINDVECVEQFLSCPGEALGDRTKTNINTEKIGYKKKICSEKQYNIYKQKMRKKTFWKFNPNFPSVRHKYKGSIICLQLEFGELVVVVQLITLSATTQAEVELV